MEEDNGNSRSDLSVERRQFTHGGITRPEGQRSLGDQEVMSGGRNGMEVFLLLPSSVGSDGVNNRRRHPHSINSTL